MSKTWMEVDDADRVECANCAWTGEGRDLEPISDFADRVAPGETCPAGECPKCGALAHLVDEEEPQASAAPSADAYPQVTAAHPRPWYLSCEGDESTVYDANGLPVFSVAWDGLEAGRGGNIDALQSLLDMQPEPAPRTSVTA